MTPSTYLLHSSSMGSDEEESEISVVLERDTLSISRCVVCGSGLGLKLWRIIDDKSDVCHPIIAWFCSGLT